MEVIILRKTVKLTFPIIFTFLISIDVLFDAPLLHGVGWVYLLPNHDYLYVFLLLPLTVFFAVRLCKSSFKELLAPGLSSILIIGGISYILGASALLWRMPFIPLGAIPLVMGLILIREGIELFKPDHFGMNGNMVRAVIGSLCIFLLSTIYLQPWKLVLNMPDVADVNFQNIDLRQTYFNQIKFDNVNFDNANFSGASLIGVDFTNVSLQGVNFTGANIEGCKFTSSDLNHADFSGARIYQTRFDDSNLSSSNLAPGFIARTYITNSLLCNAKFNDLKSGVYGWTGSKINSGALPLKGDDSGCCGKLDASTVTITKDGQCEAEP